MKQRIKYLAFFTLLIQLGQLQPLHSQVYQPIGIDTSCYWITDGTITDGIQQCVFEHALVVQKDTIINGIVYQKCFTYLTFLTCNPANSYLANNVTQSSYLILREDTIAKVLLSLVSGTEKIVIDFNLNVADTIEDCSQINKRTIDSVVLKNYVGVNRRTTYSVFPGYLGSQYGYETIEGIGSNKGISCPNWGTQLNCYSKNGVELYNSTACPKPAPLGIEDIETKSLKARFDGQKLLIDNGSAGVIKIKLYNISGQLVHQTITKEISPIINVANFSSGMYIVTVESDTESKRMKIVR